MQAFQERYVLQVDTSEMDSARSDISETVPHEFVRRPGSGRRKQHTPWRSPWDASVCTVFASLPASCSPLKPGMNAVAAAAAASAAADCLTPCSLAPTSGAGGARRGKGKQELCGPCCHCGATSSPQWRKGPKGKPILCNACGIRFLRTRSLGKVTPKKRRSPAGAGGGGAAAKRLKLEDDDSDADEGRTSSGVEDALEEVPPPDAETEEPTDEPGDDTALMHLHTSLQAAAAAVKLEATAPRPAGSAAGRHGLDDGGAAAGAAADFVAAIRQQQQLLLQQRAAAAAATAAAVNQKRVHHLAILQQLQAAAAAAQRGGAAAPPPPPAAALLPQQLAVLQALGFGGGGALALSPQLLKREGQGSAPSSPLVAPLALPLAAAPAAGSYPLTPGSALASTTTAVPLPALGGGAGAGALDASLRLLLAGMLPGGALAAAGVGAGGEDPAVLVQRSRSRGPATSGKTA